MQWDCVIVVRVRASISRNCSGMLCGTQCSGFTSVYLLWESLVVMLMHIKLHCDCSLFRSTAVMLYFLFIP